MADYTDLLRRAVEALPENNGASRRQVYEKARNALKAQLRAINLPARDVTQHRLQLEDCIRAVEEQATERLLGGLTRYEAAAFDVSEDEAELAAHADQETSDDNQQSDDLSAQDQEPEISQRKNIAAEIDVTKSDPPAEDVSSVEDEAQAGAEPDALAVDEVVSNDEEIAQTVEKLAADLTADDEDNAETDVVETEAGVGTASDDTAVESDLPAAVNDTSDELLGVKKPTSKKETFFSKDSSTGEADEKKTSSKSSALLFEPDSKNLVDTPEVSVAPETIAMSSVREVDATPIQTPRDDPQSTIDHALARLDRAANGHADADDDVAEPSDTAIPDFSNQMPDSPSDFGQETGGGNALTIFLVLFVVLLSLVGGAGYWAWREGFVDLEALLGSENSLISQQLASDSTPDGANETTSPATGSETPVEAVATGPGNTVATPPVDAPETQLIDQSEQLTPNTEVPAAVTPRIIAQPNADETKSEDRLPGSVAEVVEATGTEDGEPAAPAEVVATGSQSLLLEATESGKTGAVPFSGTVEWTRAVDETGQPTLLAKASIPARNMRLDLLIRKNADPTLPASHLMEIEFFLSDSFIGGGIGRIAGVLLKNEELVQGSALVGASARITGNSFLFALSASDQDKLANNTLLRTRKWLDLATLYSTGKQAIITLEKDEAAQALFEEIMDIWAATDASQ